MNDTTPPQFRRILAATDFSEAARQAARRAAALATQCHASLTLMHVVPASLLPSLRGWLSEESAVEQGLHAQARETLALWSEDLQGQYGIPVRTVHSLGKVVDDLLIEASTQGADVVVVGARGEGLLRRLRVGTIADRLLRLSSRPVLVVRNPAGDPYRRVLVALDLEPGCGDLIALARQCAPGARLVLFHAYQVPFESKLRRVGVDPQTVERYRRQARVDAEHRVHEVAVAAGLQTGDWEPCVRDGEAWMELVEQEQQQHVDLVVVAKHGQSLAEDLLLGSVTNHVLGEGQADLLVSPPLKAVAALGVRQDLSQGAPGPR